MRVLPGGPVQLGQLGSDNPEEEKRQKDFKSLLNKITLDNYDTIRDKIVAVGIAGPVTLRGLIDQARALAPAPSQLLPEAWLGRQPGYSTLWEWNVWLDPYYDAPRALHACSCSCLSWDVAGCQPGGEPRSGIIRALTCMFRAVLLNACHTKHDSCVMRVQTWAVAGVLRQT